MRNSEEDYVRDIRALFSSAPQQLAPAVPQCDAPARAMHLELLKFLNSEEAFMKRVYGDEFRIDSEDEFSLECDYAKAVLDRAEEEGRGDQLQWFFQEAYVNFKASTATAIFGSYNLPEYKGFSLSVSASKQPDDSWKCDVIKKIASKEQS